MNMSSLPSYEIGITVRANQKNLPTVHVVLSVIGVVDGWSCTYPLVESGQARYLSQLQSSAICKVITKIITTIHSESVSSLSVIMRPAV